jgi:hypothetical protein
MPKLIVVLEVVDLLEVDLIWLVEMVVLGFF